MGSDPRFPYPPADIAGCFDPLVRRIRSLRRAGETLVVAIQGGQGTGKTTLARYLVNRLSDETHRVASFSIDDFYSSYEDRRQLAAKFPGNPYYQLPRGMPGTHRTAVLHEALSRLKAGVDIDLPVFDKSLRHGWGDIAETVVAVRERQDVVIFEGWCVGAPVATPDEVIDICRREDQPLPDANHLGAVLAHLPPYQPLWPMADLLVMMRPDSWRLHARWRLEQEQDLRSRSGTGMTDEEVQELVRRFLPVTYLCYERLRPDVCLRIDAAHRCYEMTAS